ncbi:unnamed protein product, partial [Allacma fusca]
PVLVAVYCWDSKVLRARMETTLQSSLLEELNPSSGLMEAIQDSIFKAIESMELAANNTNNYQTIIKHEPIAFTNELMVNSGVIPSHPPVSEDLPLQLLPSEETETENYSYEILTPVQIFWPEPDLNDSSQTSGLCSTSLSDTYLACDNSSTSSSHLEEVVQGDFQQEMILEESSSLPETSHVTSESSSEEAKNKKKLHKCEICSKAFAQAYRLRTHISTVHLGTKPYQCNICSRAFARKSYLQQHGQVHAETKKFRCDLCQTAYARMADYKKHCRKTSHVEKLKGGKGTLDENNSRISHDQEESFGIQDSTDSLMDEHTDNFVNAENSLQD